MAASDEFGNGRAARRSRLGAQSVAETRAEIERLTSLARLLDSRFRLPFVPIRFGLDTIVGLVPGVGDTATALPALYLI